MGEFVEHLDGGKNTVLLLLLTRQLAYVQLPHVVTTTAALPAMGSHMPIVRSIVGFGNHARR